MLPLPSWWIPTMMDSGPLSIWAVKFSSMQRQAIVWHGQMLWRRLCRMNDCSPSISWMDSLHERSNVEDMHIQTLTAGERALRSTWNGKATQYRRIYRLSVGSRFDGSVPGSE